MRSPDYDASKPIPADLVATKPVVISVSNTRNGKVDRDYDDDGANTTDANDYEPNERSSLLVIDSDDEV
jgi:hypothetical protein